MSFQMFELFLFLLFVVALIISAIVKFFVKTAITGYKIVPTIAETVHEKAKDVVKALRPHKALIAIANNPDNNELKTISNNDNSIEWIDIECKNNKKLYDTKGNVIVIGTPSPKIHAMATYDINGNIIEDSSVKVRHDVKKVIFMDPEDKKDEKGKLKKLYEEGYISKSRYNSLMRDLNK